MTRQKMFSGGWLLAAAAAGVATTALGSTATANASCASISGISTSNSGGSICATTNFGDAAIAVGPGTKALASGGFNMAIAINPKPNTTGPQTEASATGGRNNFAFAYGSAGPNQFTTNMTQPTTAQAGIVTNFPLNVGTTSGGNSNYAFAYGNGTLAAAGGVPLSFGTITGDNNVARVIGNGSLAGAFGNGPVSVDAIGDNSASISVSIQTP